MNILETKNLKKIYSSRFSNVQVQALENVNFSVEKGEFVAIMGESGSGKTTLLNLLATLDKPTSGKVILNGKDITHLSSKEVSSFRRNHLGFVFQDFNLLDTFSNRDNILLPLVLNGTSVSEMEQRLNPIATSLGIISLLNKFLPCILISIVCSTGEISSINNDSPLLLPFRELEKVLSARFCSIAIASATALPLCTFSLSGV